MRVFNFTVASTTFRNLSSFTKFFPQKFINVDAIVKLKAVRVSDGYSVSDGLMFFKITSSGVLVTH